MGELKVTLRTPGTQNAGNINLDHAGNLDLRRLKAWECPMPGAPQLDTRIMSILCNAMQFKVQCRMPDPDGVRFRAGNSSVRSAGNQGGALFDSGKDPPLS